MQEESAGEVFKSQAVIRELIATKATVSDVYSRLGQPSDVEKSVTGFTWIYVKTANDNSTYYFPIPLPGPIIVMGKTGQILENIHITIQQISFTIEGRVSHIKTQRFGLKEIPESSEMQYKASQLIVQRVRKEMKGKGFSFNETFAWEKAEEFWNVQKFGKIVSSKYKN